MTPAHPPVSFSRAAAAGPKNRGEGIPQILHTCVCGTAHGARISHSWTRCQLPKSLIVDVLAGCWLRKAAAFLGFHAGEAGQARGPAASPNPSYLRIHCRASRQIPPFLRPHSGALDEIRLPQIPHSWPLSGSAFATPKAPFWLPARLRTFPRSLIVTRRAKPSDAWRTAQISHSWLPPDLHTKAVTARTFPKNLIIAPQIPHFIPRIPHSWPSCFPKYLTGVPKFFIIKRASP
jgi:hypothetical protein